MGGSFWVYERTNIKGKRSSELLLFVTNETKLGLQKDTAIPACITPPAFTSFKFLFIVQKTQQLWNMFHRQLKMWPEVLLKAEEPLRSVWEQSRKAHEGLSLNWMCAVILQSKEVGAPFSNIGLLRADAKQCSGSWQRRQTLKTTNPK